MVIINHKQRRPKVKTDNWDPEIRGWCALICPDTWPLSYSFSVAMIPFTALILTPGCRWVKQPILHRATSSLPGTHYLPLHGHTCSTACCLGARLISPPQRHGGCCANVIGRKKNPLLSSGCVLALVYFNELVCYITVVFTADDTHQSIGSSESLMQFNCHSSPSDESRLEKKKHLTT